MGRNIVVCTDLGCETTSIREALEAADLLVLEANHDVQRLWRGPYLRTRRQSSLTRSMRQPRGHYRQTYLCRLLWLPTRPACYLSRGL